MRNWPHPLLHAQQHRARPAQRTRQPLQRLMRWFEHAPAWPPSHPKGVGTAGIAGVDAEAADAGIVAAGAAGAVDSGAWRCWRHRLPAPDAVARLRGVAVAETDRRKLQGPRPAAAAGALPEGRPVQR